MAELIVQDETDLTGDPAYVPADINGDFFRNDDERIVLWVRNSDAANADVIIVNGKPCSFGILPTDHPDKVYVSPGFGVVLKTETFMQRRFNDRQGFANIRYERGGVPDVTNLEVAVIRQQTIIKA